jgi:hypothetical protein
MSLLPGPEIGACVEYRVTLRQALQALQLEQEIGSQPPATGAQLQDLATP